MTAAFSSSSSSGKIRSAIHQPVLNLTKAVHSLESIMWKMGWVQILSQHYVSPKTCTLGHPYTYSHRLESEQRFASASLSQYGLFIEGAPFLPWHPSINLQDGAWHYVGFTWDEDGTVRLVADNVVSDDVSTVAHLRPATEL